MLLVSYPISTLPAGEAENRDALLDPCSTWTLVPGGTSATKRLQGRHCLYQRPPEASVEGFMRRSLASGDPLTRRHSPGTLYPGST